MSEWVSVKDRLPTEADADPMRCVLVYHLYQGVMVTGWHQVNQNRFFSHWMPTPAPPRDIRKIKEQSKFL